MRWSLLILVLGCKSGADRAKEDVEAEEARIAAQTAQAERANAPLRELRDRYHATAKATIEGHRPTGAGDIAKAAGRTIAPILATKTYPSGEQRPSYELWCRGRCDQDARIAKDPATAGVLVVVHARIDLAGTWVSSTEVGGSAKELGNGYFHRYEATAILVPENITIGSWVRWGSIPGLSDHELIPPLETETSDDLAALAGGRAPASEGTLPKTRLGGGY